MKLTLLEMTQNILSRLDSDEIDSISDNTEAMQVAKIVRNTFFNFIARANLPEQKTLFNLTASGSALQPTLMVRPDTVSKIEWLKYNKRLSTDTVDKYDYVTILPMQQFIEMVDVLNTDDTNVGTMTVSGMSFNYTDNLAPTYCTIVDDVNFIFDSYDSAVDTTLQSSKTKGFGQTIPSFTLSDSFIPDLDDQQFPLLLNEATAVAFVDMKQIPNEKAEQEARRQWRTLQRTKSLSNVPSSFDALPHFGRKY